MSTRLVPPCIWVWLLSASDLLLFSNKDAGAAMGLCCLGMRVTGQDTSGQGTDYPHAPPEAAS